MSAAASDEKPRVRRLVVLLPLALFLALAALFFFRLGSGDPSRIPSALVNVWASWCVPCHDEAPLLDALSADKRIRIVGINYKDQPDNARRFLGRYGNPFAAAGADGNGRASMEWGVYGVPETFIVGRDGKIAYKLVGPITPANLQAVIKPEIEKALTAR